MDLDLCNGTHNMELTSKDIRTIGEILAYYLNNNHDDPEDEDMTIYWAWNLYEKLGNFCLKLTVEELIKEGFDINDYYCRI